MDRKQGAVGDLVMGIIFIILGVYVAISALQMKVFNNFVDAPGFFPLILGGIFVILGLALTVPSLKAGGGKAFTETFSTQELGKFFKDDKTVRTIILAVLMVVYIFVLVGRVPFIAASFLYLTATMFYLRSTSWWKIILISIAASILISVAFRHGFRIPLP